MLKKNGYKIKCGLLRNTDILGTGRHNLRSRGGKGLSKIGYESSMKRIKVQVLLECSQRHEGSRKSSRGLQHTCNLTISLRFRTDGFGILSYAQEK